MSRMGLSPQAREAIGQLGKAIAGDMVLSITPATVAPAPTAAAWTRKVVVALESADGKVHDWFNKSVTSGVSIGDTSTAGTASIASTTLVFKNGVAEVTVSGDAASWLDTETDTLTVANLTILSETITGGTSVETFTA